MRTRNKACLDFLHGRHLTKLLPAVQEMQGIQDMTETNVVNLRRIIYLTIMNALNYEEAVHKLLKVQMSEGQEVCVITSFCEPF